VGGGLPIGVLGGRADIMNIFCHENTEKPLYHSGTFNGYETVMQAGFAALSKFDEKAVARVNGLGDRFQEGLKETFAQQGLNIRSTQIGSLLNLHFVNEPISTPEQVLASEEELHTLMHLSLLNKGVFSIPRGLFILSTVMTASQIDGLVETIAGVLEELGPLIRENYRHLLAG
ncbi:MAG TPA: glutamate-1-semialdehyde 2,1-aminomutase, partial [Desulfobacteraceae bacterium]|nr:glutamate-1-semialdehyde 2,1-aminomutase [Desulfobacteraceae bacterium]